MAYLRVRLVILLKSFAEDRSPKARFQSLAKACLKRLISLRTGPLGEYWDLRPLDNAHARHTQKKDTTKGCVFLGFCRKVSPTKS